MKRFLPLLASLVLLGALLASVEGEPAQAASTVAARRPTLELHQTDALGRHFWRPAGSDARPPAPRRERCRWRPGQGRSGACAG